jgi:hypothetical protein
MKNSVDERVVGNEEASTLFGGSLDWPTYLTIKGVYFGNPFHHTDEEGELAWVDYYDSDGNIFRVWND